MPKPSRFSGDLHGRLPRIARRLRKRMNELGLSQVALAARCTVAAQDLFPEDLAPQITRERIARILMHSKGDPGKSAAHVISHSELLVLASVLQVSPEWLAGRNDSRDLVLWDPLADPARADHILHLMNEHEDRATEVLIWAEYLICSLVTPEFMHKHHEALFKEIDILGTHDEKRKVVKIYDNIGNARRKRLLDSQRRGRRLVQFIFASDIERIVRGEGEYANIQKGLRKACLENVANLLSNSSLRVELVIVKDEDANGVKAAFRDYDSIGVFGNNFVLWRYHSGRISWSEHPDHTGSYREMLKAIEARAGTRNALDILTLMGRLSDSVR
jgi:transcriptional regulator with XRE-family HTH domain